MSDKDNEMTPVHEAKILVTVLGEDENPSDLQHDIECLSLEDLGRAMDQGDFIGSASMISFRQVPEGEIAHRLLDVGNDGTFFDSDEQERPRVGRLPHAETRVENMAAEEGWNRDTMQALAVEYLREIGMADDFASWLEEKAKSDHELDAPGP